MEFGRSEERFLLSQVSPCVFERDFNHPSRKLFSLGDREQGNLDIAVAIAKESIRPIFGDACQLHEHNQLHTVPLMVKTHLDREMQYCDKLELVFRPHDRLLLLLYVQPTYIAKLLSDLDLISCNLTGRMGYCVLTVRE